MSSRTCRETTLWLAEDPGAMPPPPTSGREGQGVILCLMVSLLLTKIGTPDFWRLRLGIGHPRTLGLAQQVADFVLHQPRKEELPDIEHALARCLLAWPKLSAGDFAGAQQQLHGKAV